MAAPRRFAAGEQFRSAGHSMGNDTETREPFLVSVHKQGGSFIATNRAALQIHFDGLNCFFS
jgi:hypothetical protein